MARTVTDEYGHGVVLAVDVACDSCCWNVHDLWVAVGCVVAGGLADIVVGCREVAGNK